MRTSLAWCIEGLCGVGKSYTANQSNMSNAIFRALADNDPDDMNELQQEQAQRTLAAGIAWLRERSLAKKFKRRAWERKSGPGVDKEPDYGFHRLKNLRAGLQQVFDHSTRLVEGEKIKYIGEPYSLSADDLRALLALEDEGWKVHIDAGWSTHFPSRTTAVIVEAKEPK